MDREKTYTDEQRWGRQTIVLFGNNLDDSGLLTLKHCWTAVSNTNNNKNKSFKL